MSPLIAEFYVVYWRDLEAEALRWPGYGATSGALEELVTQGKQHHGFSRDDLPFVRDWVRCEAAMMREQWEERTDASL